MKNFFEYFKIAFPIILSAAALGVSIFDYFLKKPKIDCRLDDIYDSYWIHGNELTFKNSGYGTKSLLNDTDVVVMSLLIINKKSVPISIIDIYRDDVVADHNFKFLHPKLKSQYFKERLAIESQKVTFPHRMNGYDILRTSISFPVDRSDEKNRTYKLTIKSPYKDYNFNLTVQSFNNQVGHKKNGMYRGLLLKELDKHTNNRSEKYNYHNRY